MPVVITILGILVYLDRNLLLYSMGSSRSHQRIQAVCSAYERLCLVLQIATLTLYLTLCGVGRALDMWWGLTGQPGECRLEHGQRLDHQSCMLCMFSRAGGRSSP